MMSEMFAGIEQLNLQPIKRIEGHVKLPGSKSLSNRILLLAALSEGTTEVQNLLVRPSQSTFRLMQSLYCRLASQESELDMHKAFESNCQSMLAGQ